MNSDFFFAAVENFASHAWWIALVPLARVTLTRRAVMRAASWGLLLRFVGVSAEEIRATLLAAARTDLAARNRGSGLSLSRSRRRLRRADRPAGTGLESARSPTAGTHPDSPTSLAGPGHDG